MRSDPTSTHVYVGNLSDVPLLVFDINPRTGGFFTNVGLGVVTPPMPAAVVFLTGPGPVAYQPRLAYAPNGGAINAIFTYPINNATGALQSAATTAIATGTAPVAAVIDPKNRFFYVANNGDATVSSYAIASDGSLAALGAAPTSSSPWALDIDPTGRFLYVVSGATATTNGSLDAFVIDQSNGTLTGRTSMSTAIYPVSVAVDATGRIVFVATAADKSVRAYPIDPSTGALPGAAAVKTSALGSCGSGAADLPRWLAVDPVSPLVFAATATQVYTLRYYVSDGSVFSEGCSSAGLPADIKSIAIHPSGQFAYIAGMTSGNIGTASINPEGSGTQIVQSLQVDSYGYAYGLTVDQSGRFVYMANGVGALAGGVQALAVQPAALSAINTQPATLAQSIVVLDDVQ